MEKKVTIRKPVFITMAAIYIFIIVLGLVNPEAFANGEAAIVDFACRNFAWAYQILTICLIGFCFWVMFNKKIGDIKLGGKDAKPIMSKWAWFVITLCGGIATGIVFWGIAEPLTHFFDGIPLFPGIEPGTPEAAKMALSTTYLHWGLGEYAYYAVPGIVIGFAVYNMKLPYRISSCLYPLFGKKVMGKIGTFIDILCVFGIAGGVSASLCEGALQIGAGIGLISGLTPNNVIWIVILTTVVITFILSSYTGINKGVRFFSDANAKIYLALLAFILFFGPSMYILNLMTEAMGWHISHFFEQALYTGSWNVIEGEADMWPTWWTVNYWSWMIAYAPLMGIFLAKVARGRSLREFTIYNFILPGLFDCLWFGIFGGAAIKFDLDTDSAVYNLMSEKGMEAAVFGFFKNLPATQILQVVFIFTVFISIVTLADSMTTTISSLSINAKNAATVEPPAKVKIFWGVCLSLVAFVNLATASTVGKVSGIDATKSLAISVAAPLTIIMILILIAGVKMLSHADDYNVVDNPEGHKVDPELIVDYDVDDVID